MTAPTESKARPAEKTQPILLPPDSDRRADIEGKHARVASLLPENDCEGLLILEPENFAWLTGGAAAWGAVDPVEMPGLFFTAGERWLLSSNVDSQRLFDEEISGLGFQVREWPWYLGRRQFLADFCHGRRLACDRPRDNGQFVGDRLRHFRLALTEFEQSCYRLLGQIVGHALEATCRSLTANDFTEQEIAAQISHRVLNKGAEPVAIGVAADGRSQLYRQGGATEARVGKHCVATLTAQKFGLCVAASRSVSFGPAEEAFAKEQEAACKIAATYIASTWPDALPSQILAAGRRVYQVTGYEHEWRYSPQGHITGRVPVELTLTPQTEELFQIGWPITWRASVGAALSCDTFIITDKGPVSVTVAESWPQKRIRVQGAEFLRPFIYQKNS
jgi:Xaa-Pro aminopeptidase